VEETFFDIHSITLRQGSDAFILLLGLYVFIHIYGNRRVNLKSNQLLSFLVLQFIVMTINSLLISLNLLEIYLPICFTNFSLIYFIAPTSYLYILSLTTEKFRFSPKILVHLAIPILYLILSLGLNLNYYIRHLMGDETGFDKAMDLFLQVQWFVFRFFTPLQFVIYTVITNIEYSRYRKKIKHFFSYNEGVQLRWILGFILGFSLFILLMILSNNDLLFIPGLSQSFYDLVSYAEYLLFVGFIGYYGSHQVNYYEYATANKTSTEIPDNIPEAFSANSISTETFQVADSNAASQISEAFTLNPEKKTLLKEAILKLVNEKKIYLNASLTVENIATDLQTNSKYISYVINDSFQKNFYNFVNEYRIQSAIDFLSDSKYGHYSIEGIGNLAGFKSKSSFNAAFKKQTGKTPSEYKSGLN
jgi:AraC-like DNA-binding protein